MIWPALLMSAGYELPAGEFIHGYLLMGGEKMSKTRGNVLDPFAVIEEVGADPLRYYLMREVTLRAGRRREPGGLAGALQQRLSSSADLLRRRIANLDWLEGEVVGVLFFGLCGLVVLAVPFLDQRAARGASAAS